MSTNMPSGSTFSSQQLGYTPESHNSKPRNISSNEIRQRTLDGSQGPIYSGGIDSYPNQELHFDINLNM